MIDGNVAAGIEGGNVEENLDRAFFDRRAEELSQAQRAANPAAVKAHYHLAGYYLDRVYDRRGINKAAFVLINLC